MVVTHTRTHGYTLVDGCVAGANLPSNTLALIKTAPFSLGVSPEPRIHLCSKPKSDMKPVEIANIFAFLPTQPKPCGMAQKLTGNVLQLVWCSSEHAPCACD